MKLISIPKDKYEDYRLDLIFNCYKWDPQFLDNNTIAKHALILTKEEHHELVKLVEKLDKETRNAEEFLNNNQKLTKVLKLPLKIKKEIKKMKNYDSKNNVRLMRYDFHPTIENKWAVSEVNSDVPGGFAEASLMPELANNILNKKYWYENFGNILADQISKKVKKNGTIMLVHCTSYSDDRQVMQFLGDKLEFMGFNIIYAASDHLIFKNGEAISVLNKNEGKVDFIFRYTPLEWLVDVKPKKWQGYFNTITPSCNHPISIFAQTKRFPLVWELLEKNDIKMKTWKKLLPETLEVKKCKNKEGYIYKPAWGRVGEKISIKEACKDDEYKKIMIEVKRHPNKYLAQKKFSSKEIISDDGMKFHLCLGVYTVEGKYAGYYARVSQSPRIDSNAADIPVLIERN